MRLMIGVGIVIAHDPLLGPGRALISIRFLSQMCSGEAGIGKRMKRAGLGKPSLS